MLLLLRTEEDSVEIYDKIEVAIEILNRIYGVMSHCVVLFDNDIRMEDGRNVRGRYMYVTKLLPCSSTSPGGGIIAIDTSCNFIEMCTILVHEYAHHLTQEGHNGKLFNLFRSWLREEFTERWRNYVEGRKD